MQYQEEWEHALKFLDFVNDRGWHVTLYATDQPQFDFQSPLVVFEHSLAHEQKVTGMMKNLYTLAAKENDYPAQVLLQWFISKQVEEEKNAQRIVDQLRWAGESSSALVLLDQGAHAKAAKSKGKSSRHCQFEG